MEPIPPFLSNEQLLEVLSATKTPTAIHVSETAIIQMANDAMLLVWGKDRSVIGKSLENALPELKGQPFIDLFKKVWNEGSTISGTDAPAHLEIEGIVQTFYFDFEYRAILSNEGKTLCILHTATDITERFLRLEEQKRANESEDALNREQLLNEELASTNEELKSTNDELHETQQSLMDLNYELEERVSTRIQEVEELNKQLSTKNREFALANKKQIAYNNELAEVNEKLKSSQDELQLAISTASLATFDLNPATNHFVGNDLLKAWFGLKPEQEIELNTATDVIDEADRKRVILAISHAMDYTSGGDYDTVYTILNPENLIPRIVRAKGKALFNEQRQPVRLSGVLQDITEQKQDDQRKNDFIGMVSHELKTPLTSIYAYIYIMIAHAQKNKDNFTTGLLEKAKIQMVKMTTMINGFLDVSRLESGKIHIDKQPFNMADLIKETEDEIIITVTTHQIIFEPVEPTFVCADKDKIGHVLNNFISNAVKYSPHASAIQVACITKNNRAIVSVQDKGIGITAKDKDRLFDRFYRVENTQTKSIAGFGIGLYLSAEIIQRHEGKIWVESELDKGSTFYFSLPMV